MSELGSSWEWWCWCSKSEHHLELLLAHDWPLWCFNHLLSWCSLEYRSYRHSIEMLWFAQLNFGMRHLELVDVRLNELMIGVGLCQSLLFYFGLLSCSHVSVKWPVVGMRCWTWRPLMTCIFDWHQSFPVIIACQVCACHSVHEVTWWSQVAIGCHRWLDLDNWTATQLTSSYLKPLVTHKNWNCNGLLFTTFALVISSSHSSCHVSPILHQSFHSRLGSHHVHRTRKGKADHRARSSHECAQETTRSWTCRQMYNWSSNQTRC